MYMCVHLAFLAHASYLCLSQIGKVVPASIATSSKPKLELPSKPGLKREASVSKSKEQSAEPVKKEVKEDAPKPAKGPGKLDWSKAKPKGAVAKGTKAKGSDEPKKVKEEAMDTDVSEDTKKPVVKKEGSKSLSEKESKAPLKAESSTSAKLEPTKVSMHDLTYVYIRILSHLSAAWD